MKLIQLRTGAAAAASLLILGAFSLASADTAFRVRTTLAGSAIKGLVPVGHVDFRVDDKGRRRLSVEAENVKLPIGTVLSVQILQDGMALPLTPHQFKLAGDPEPGNRGELDDESENGAMIPDLSHGNFVIHVNEGGRTILSGALHD